MGLHFYIAKIRTSRNVKEEVVAALNLDTLRLVLPKTIDSTVVQSELEEEL